MVKPTLVIDGDIILYQAAQGAEEEVEWEPDMWTVNSDLNKAKAAVKYSIDDLKFRTELDDIIIALSDTTNFRKTVYPEYKANRSGSRKPVGYKALKEWIQTEYPSIIKPGIEADDVMGIMATHPDKDVVLWTLDKDLKTIPGKLLKDDEWLEISQREADYFFLCQVLAGDPVDNFPGCRGIGMKTAEKLMPFDAGFDVNVYWQTKVIPAYAKAGFDADFALTQARLARILRWEDWDADKQEPILWTP